MALSKAIRAAAWGMVAAGVAAPLLRKRLPLRPAVSQAIAYSAPLGLSIAVRRSPKRDIAVCALQMWAYVAAYKSPHDDVSAQASRVRVNYPIVLDRVLGVGELPSTRLQRAFARNGPEGPSWTRFDAVLVWTHWSWFAVPHGSLLYILARRPERFPRAAVSMYAVFNLGAVVYWIVPTAPPWYAAGAREETASGERSTSAPVPLRGAVGRLEVRRMMVEYGEYFWKGRWGSLYSVFGGNPLAAMPSLHFATSVMAALLLAETGPIAGALGGLYAATLAVSLVYLGEHYVVDLLAGAALTGAVRRWGPAAAPALARFGSAVAALEAKAQS